MVTALRLAAEVWIAGGTLALPSGPRGWSAGGGRGGGARLHGAGARRVKLAFDDRSALPPPEAAGAAVEAAHSLGVKCAAHALEAKMVRRALDAGCDVLAHTPVEP